MLGAVHIGLVAACVVLFVPMGMAGWHLSRNKMLFFSGALFITLAVGVHLTPYFPSVSQLVSSISTPFPPSRHSCLSFLHDIVWSPNSTLTSWDWAESAPVATCAFRRWGGEDASLLLNGSWIFVAGDSQARLLVLALLNLVLDSKELEAVEVDLFKRHSDYSILIEEHGMQVDFVWAPYELNSTEALGRLEGKRRYPDVLVIGSGLWHMLHFNNATDYGCQLGLLERSVMLLFPISSEFGAVPLQSTHMFWLGMPTLVNSLLNTEEKKEKMNLLVWEAYQREISKSSLLRESGGPFALLDVASLSQKCGFRCTSDGMHYDDAVYEAALQVMLNALLIESQQQI